MKSYKKVANFILKEQIGQGNFSQVFLAIKEDDNSENPKKYAIKCLEKDMINSNPILKNLLASEATIMKDIKHKNIIHCHEFYETKNNYYLILDYCDKGDLETYLKKLRVKYLKENEAIMVIKQIIQGFKELRKYDIVHRDLKLSNIFLHKDRIKIGDFGMAKVGKTINGTTVGTPLNMAPECMQGNCSDVSKSDLWSLGILFYTLLFGEVPFFGLSLNELYQLIQKHSGQDLQFPQKPQVSENTKNLLRSLLEKDIEKRIGWREIFKHDFFKQKIRHSNSQRPKSINQSSELSTDKSYHKSKTTTDHSQNSPYSPLKVDILETSLYKQNIQPCQVIKVMKEEDKIKESYFRYIHEINIINFYLKTAQQIGDYILRHQVTDETVLLCQSMLALMSLGNFKTKTLKQSLLNRRNILEVQNFESFSLSNEFEQLVDLIYHKQNQIQSFQNYFLNDRLLSQILSSFDVQNIIEEQNQSKLQGIIQKGIQRLNQSNFTNGDSEKMRNYLLLNVIKLKIYFNIGKGMKNLIGKAYSSNMKIQVLEVQLKQ